MAQPKPPNKHNKTLNQRFFNVGPGTSSGWRCKELQTVGKRQKNIGSTSRVCCAAHFLVCIIDCTKRQRRGHAVLIIVIIIR